MMTARADTATLVTIPTTRSGTQSFILIKPDHPVAAVILFAGGNGRLGLKTASSAAANFLVRSRDKFAAHNFIVAVVDAPSDYQQDGMNVMFRVSPAHARDIGAIVSYLKNDAALPVWLIGTSAGTFSAAIGAIAEGKNIDGLVLTSTVTRTPREWEFARSHPNGVADMALSEITVPTLIMSHRNDLCAATPASDAAMLKMRLTKTSKAEIARLDGGDPPRSSPCEAKAAHGYFGIETEAVDTIANFITSNSK
jgi:pimeloyl-ACP methyl ester carboxylesterase